MGVMENVGLRTLNHSDVWPVVRVTIVCVFTRTCAIVLRSYILPYPVSYHFICELSTNFDNVAAYDQSTRHWITPAGTVCVGPVLSRRAHTSASVQNLIDMVLYVQGLVSMVAIVCTSGMVN